MNEQVDIADLRIVVEELIGQECWDAYLPDGVELHLEIGERRPVAGSVRAIELGSYGIIVGASSWHVSQPEGAAVMGANSDRWAGLTSRLELIRGTISAAQVLSTLELRLELAGRIELKVIPDRAVGSADPPFWELFRPDGSLLEVGPSGILTFSQADR
ncbi:MAG: hypothetical protein ACT4PI_05225 [Actinomycetota bacterium]